MPSVHYSPSTNRVIFEGFATPQVPAALSALAAVIPGVRRVSFRSGEKDWSQIHPNNDRLSFNEAVEHLPAGHRAYSDPDEFHRQFSKMTAAGHEDHAFHHRSKAIALMGTDGKAKEYAMHMVAYRQHKEAAVDKARKEKPVGESFYTGHASAPNPHYRCADCGRDLWSHYRRLKNPGRAPEINIGLDKKLRCKRCDAKSHKEKPVGESLSDDEKKVVVDARRKGRGTRNAYHTDLPDGHKVVTWHDGQSRNWITQHLDKDDYEVGDSNYTGHRTDAETAHAWMVAKAKGKNESIEEEKVAGAKEGYLPTVEDVQTVYNVYRAQHLGAAEIKRKIKARFGIPLSVDPLGRVQWVEGMDLPNVDPPPLAQEPEAQEQPEAKPKAKPKK